MTESPQEAQWRNELEAAGERAVRDNINSRGSLVTGGESKQQFIRKWLKEKMLSGYCANKRDSITRVGLSASLSAR
jgi:hypothetical protein